MIFAAMKKLTTTFDYHAIFVLIFRKRLETMLKAKNKVTKGEEKFEEHACRFREYMRVLLSGGELPKRWKIMFPWRLLGMGLWV